MGAEQDLVRLPDQPPPPEARCVGDLVNWVRDNQRVLFTRTLMPDADEPSFYKVSTTGGYLNNGLPRMAPLLNRPTPKRKNRTYQALSSLGEVEVAFDGDPNWMSDLYRLLPTLYFVSERLLNLLREIDPSGFEAIEPRTTGKHSSDIGPHWLVMPTRVFDAIDISKSNVEVLRSAIYRGADKFVTEVHYAPGYVFRADLTSEVPCFLEEFSGDWFWHESLIRAASEKGIRGLHFGYGQVSASREINLRGPNEPSYW